MRTLKEWMYLNAEEAIWEMHFRIWSGTEKTFCLRNTLIKNYEIIYSDLDHRFFAKCQSELLCLSSYLHRLTMNLLSAFNKILTIVQFTFTQFGRKYIYFCNYSNHVVYFLLHIFSHESYKKLFNWEILLVHVVVF